MAKITPIDSERCSVAIARDGKMSVMEHRPGPPVRADGWTFGIADMRRNAPHGGERHPDGDELIYIISGRVEIRSDSIPNETCQLGPGSLCIIPQGEWHHVHLLEPTRMIHLTPGPHGEHRPALD